MHFYYQDCQRIWIVLVNLIYQYYRVDFGFLQRSRKIKKNRKFHGIDDRVGHGLYSQILTTKKIYM
jgi:hypothetical protein